MKTKQEKEKLYKLWFDLFNPNNHPSVVILYCEDLTDEDNFEIAFCHNDMGGFWKTPQLKLHCQNWAAKNIIKGGYFLGNNNYNFSSC